MTRAVLALAVGIGLGLSGCVELTFSPPAEPLHSRSKDGYLHADRLSQPFLCGDPNDPTGLAVIPCPDERPPDNFLSCDAIGCHGGFEFTTASAENRHLRGSEAPSCYTCHGDEWNDEDDEDEEDEEDEEDD